MFDVNGPPKNPGTLFSLDCSAEESKVHILPVPFAATSSYHRVSNYAPEAIIRASQQIDLYDPILGNPWESGIYTHPFDKHVWDYSDEANLLVDFVRCIQQGQKVENFDYAVSIKNIDEICKLVYDYVFQWTQNILNNDYIPGILGGDHSVSLGCIKAASEKYDDLVVIQIDAHADLRKDYEGFIYSHASIMHNVLCYYGTIYKIIQFGIRDLCPEERLRQYNYSNIVYTFFDQLTDWDNLDLSYIDNRISTCLENEVSNILYNKPVWITCDIDGLEPSLCPNTGTPVPGGLTWKQFCKLLHAISGISNIVGFDLVEVGKEDLDANIGARALYQLIGNAVRNK